MEEKGTQKKEERTFDEHVIMCSKFMQQCRSYSSFNFTNEKSEAKKV